MCAVHSPFIAATFPSPSHSILNFTAAELYTFVYKTPVGPVNIQIPREMAVSAPQTVKFRIEWEGDGNVAAMKGE